MLTLTSPIEDVHGNRYDQAVILINTINYSANTHIQSALDVSQKPPVRNSQPSLNSIQLAFNAYIYPNLQAVTANKVPMNLRSKSGQDWHTVVLPEAVTDATDFESLCEQYVLSTIIPQLAIPVVEES